ncbi:MAG: SOS response-associated peptidase [Arcobacter sp.]|nr:SOS response-associated peptidase [Arcobacter sp.]
MPGRLAIYNDKSFKVDAKEFIKNDMIIDINKNYNISPTLPIPALLNNGNYIYTHFGYLPSWSKNKKNMNINARSESIFEKITFRDSFKFRRCIIPINGFYEWTLNDKDKIPYFISSKINKYMALAGIWDEWFDIELNMNIVTVAILTCDANEKLSKIHHRMPVILEKNNFKNWLYNLDIQAVNKLFKIYPNERIKLYEVSTEVNKVLFNNSSCIKKIDKTKSNQLSLF